ncbi:hypothetical protein CY34DRAFT_433830 [Suillus luteus UH-Slu-Lm8-n1]|uniref:Uncharacterized protein n=1 Tax=Suillus luteus UH-Slu-Lm8-n1 TaxID=930992 RepID=A0A0D0BHJ5_9AGAM|nr:hypothetical protein CY34DRAFT_433830 [Suillus luteus UH-Slu-Lm8-n1]
MWPCNGPNSSGNQVSNKYHNTLEIFHGTKNVLYLMLWTQLPTKCQVSGLDHYISRRVSTIPGLSSESR